MVSHRPTATVSSLSVPAVLLQELRTERDQPGNHQSGS